MKYNQIKKIFLTTLPVLFLFVFQASADTFSYIDKATDSMGGAGYDQSYKSIYTINTDKPRYSPGETMYITTTKFETYSNTLENPEVLFNREKLFIEGQTYSPDYSEDLLYTLNDEVYLDPNKFVAPSDSGKLITLFVDPIYSGSLGENRESYPLNPDGFYIVNYTGTYDVSNENTVLAPYIFFEIFNTNTNTEPPSLFVK